MGWRFPCFVARQRIPSTPLPHDQLMPLVLAQHLQRAACVAMSPADFKSDRATAMSRTWLPFAWRLIALGAEPLPAQSLDPAASSTQAFQAGVDEAARMAAEVPYLKPLPARQRQAHVEFVFGNVLFVAAHELGHALVS